MAILYMLSKAKEYETTSMIVTYNSYIILIRNLRKDMNDNLQQVKEITITDFESSMQIYFCTMFTNN